MLPTSWEVASLVCKLFLYFGAASIAGGSLCLWQFSDGRRSTVRSNLAYMISGAVLGFQAVILNFLIQVGLVNDDGIAGMFDWDMATILLDTQLGDVTFYRLAAFILVLITTLFFFRKIDQITRPPTKAFYRLLIALHCLALLMIAFSFRIAGHVSVLSTTAQIAIVLHVTAFAIWIGSLYPLFQLTQTDDRSLLQLAMKRFGNLAIAILGVLLVAAVIMLLQLFNSFSELVTTAYGLAIMLKLLLVAVIFTLAGINKLYLVPKINSEGGAGKLRSSIRYEMIVATTVLMVTAYLSTVVGPVEH